MEQLRRCVFLPLVILYGIFILALVDQTTAQTGCSTADFQIKTCSPFLGITPCCNATDDSVEACCHSKDKCSPKYTNCPTLFNRCKLVKPEDQCPELNDFGLVTATDAVYSCCKKGYKKKVMCCVNTSKLVCPTGYEECRKLTIEMPPPSHEIYSSSEVISSSKYFIMFALILVFLIHCLFL